MNARLARLLTRLYPPAWRARYGSEFEALLQSGRGDLRTAANVVWSALCERISPTPGLESGLELHQGPLSIRFQSWCVRAPWAMFGLAPLVLLAASYFVACFVLWSGWRIFLPGAETPFVRIDGFAIYYFGIGRMTYFTAPVLIGWGMGLVAMRQRVKAIWPVAGLVLIAWMGGAARVHANPSVSGGAGDVSMSFAFAHSLQGISDSLFHALLILSLTVPPYLLLRFLKGRFLSA
jgi:hypothetical protein